MRGIFRFSAFIVILFFPVLNSCVQESDDQFENNVSLVSADRKATMTETNIQTLLTVASNMYPELSEIYDDVKNGVVVYSVKYKSTFNGENITASGVIAVPDAAGDYPVMIFQNGTNTLYSNAPSVNPFSTLYQMIESVASTGYVVAIPDYIGFGASENIFHPYLIKDATVKSALDMLRACREFDTDIAKDITFRNEYYLLGYSQGGWSTLSLLEAIDQEYSGEFDVKACACGAGPYDINYFNSYILGQNEYPVPAFLAYIARAYSVNGIIDNTVSDIFKEPYASAIETDFDGKHSIDQINDELTTVISDLFTDNYISGHETSDSFKSFRQAMTENSIKAWNTSVPLLFVHGSEDAYVTPSVTTNMYNDMVNISSTGGANIHFISLPGLSHTDAVVPACIEGLKFFKEIKK